MSRKLREIYEYDLIEEDGMDNAVDEWFNTIMEKTKDQLSLADVSRMLRQKICSRIAIKRAIEMLSDDPFVGEMFEGQLMFNLYNGKEKYLRLFYPQMSNVLEKAEDMAKCHHFSSEEDKREYITIISKFAEKIKEETA
jgi:hypothetical protein